MHVGHELTHLGELGLGGVDDEVRTLGYDLELVVGHEGGDLHDDVAVLLEAGHL